VAKLRVEAKNLEDLGSVAARALDEIHAAIYGCPPESRSTWSSGAAMLIVLRSKQAVPAEPVSELTPPFAAIQRMVATAVLSRTGETLRPAGRSTDPSRRLAVLAFEHIVPKPPDRTLRGVPEPATKLR
jgi:hypothetical protein